VYRFLPVSAAKNQALRQMQGLVKALLGHLSVLDTWRWWWPQHSDLEESGF